MLSRKALLLLMLVVLGWGTSWTVIKFTIAEIPPLTFRGLSAMIAGIGLLALARLWGMPVRVPRGAWPRLLVLAFFNTTVWHAFSTYGVLFLSSGQAALLGYTMPLWCVPLSIWLLGEQLTVRRVISVLLGLGGIAILMGKGVHAISASPVGAVLMIVAAAAWATGVVLLKRWQIAMPTLVLTAWLMILGAVPLLAGAAWVDGVPAKAPSWPALGGLVFSILVTFMLCNCAWNRLVLMVPVAVSSLSSLITPLVGVVSGIIFLQERPDWNEAIAALMILGSVAVINLQRLGRPVRPVVQARVANQ